MKLSLFADDMVLHIGRFHKKLSELINESRKVAGYKINMQKPVVFLYISSDQLEKEIKKTILFIVASKKNKILRNKLRSQKTA